MTGADKRPRIAFLGTGAQGASIGADFALAGLDVTFIEQWPEHVEAIRRDGITVNLPSRTINVRVPALHLCQVAEIKEPFDLVFLVVKAYDTKWACQLIKPCLAPDGLVIGLQNGMTHEDIADVVGRHRTVGAVIEIASNMFVPGITNRQNDHDTSWFALGALDPANQDRVEHVAELLRHSGRVEVLDDIHSAKWMKLVVNAAELIPSAIVNLPLADAARHPGMLEVMREAGYEAMQAALADGAQHNQPSGTVRGPNFRRSPKDVFPSRHAHYVSPGLAKGPSGRGAGGKWSGCGHTRASRKEGARERTRCPGRFGYREGGAPGPTG